MRCLAGVEFEGGKPCPECGAKLGEVCWPGINADLLEVAKLRKENEWLRRGIKDYLDGNFGPRLPSKLDKCEHGRFRYEGCENCIDKHFEHVLSQASALSSHHQNTGE
jgi:hypothetical protein